MKSRQERQSFELGTAIKFNLALPISEIQDMVVVIKLHFIFPCGRSANNTANLRQTLASTDKSSCASNAHAIRKYPIGLFVFLCFSLMHHAGIRCAMKRGYHALQNIQPIKISSFMKKPSALESGNPSDFDQNVILHDRHTQINKTSSPCFPRRHKVTVHLNETNACAERREREGPRSHVIL